MRPLRVVFAAVFVGTELMLAGCGAGGTGASASPPAGSGTIPPPAEPPAESRLNVVLGRPTDTSVAVSVLTNPGTQVCIEYGTSAGRYEGTSATVTAPSRGPAVADVSGLHANTRYVHRVRWRGPGDTNYQVEVERTFHTQRGPGGFYSADTLQVPGVGYVRDYCAWEWGDAPFVVLDPSWHSPVPVENGVPGVDRPKDPWEATIGDEQYAWLTSVLERSRAKCKFVFEHHVLGTGRGAAALVHQYEWGGYTKNAGDEAKAGGANGSVAFAYTVLPDRSGIVDEPPGARR